MRPPYRRRVPARHWQVLLALHRAYPGAELLSGRQVADRAGVPLKRVWLVLNRLREAGWADKKTRWVSYSMPFYGWTLTSKGFRGVNALMAVKHRKKRHHQVPRCKWNPGRIEGEASEPFVRARPKVH